MAPQAQSQYGPQKREEYDTKQRVMPTQKARAGIELHRMRYVLGFGIAGVVIAFLLTWYFMFRT